MNRHFRIRQIIILLAWLLPVFFAVSGSRAVSDDIPNKVTYAVFLILALHALYLVIFALFVPYWLSMLIVLWIKNNKAKLNQNGLYAVIGFFYMVAAIAFLLLLTGCEIDGDCMTGGSLITGGGVIVFAFLSVLFGTLPFGLISQKLISRLRKV